MPIENLINLDDKAKQALDLLQTTDFDIFQVKKATNENELITVTTFILHKHRLF
jgi:hypothetical protein